jgi:resuscitation-promoting factor RpfA
MNCQNCEYPILPSDEKCPHCGALPLRQRVTFGARREEFALTREDEPFELGELAQADDWQSSVEEKSEPEHPLTKPASPSIPEIHWGGFFRRACAFVIDGIVILTLSMIMFVMCYVGYKVGLSAHGRALTWERSTPFFVLFTWGWIGLATAYFVIFHGLEGKTIGKWLLGLRVVGAERSAVTYRRAFLRWLGMVGFAPVLLGFLWILWSREKRGWHDFLARTWVIRD